MDDICCKDIISDLPEALICHILSFIPTKEAALTSLLSKKWRYLFAFAPNLDFDDSLWMQRPIVDMNEIYRKFMDFVDRVLGLQGNSTLVRFSLKCENDIYSECVFSWISNVIERGVSDLELGGTLGSNRSMPSSVFLSKSLVKLRIDTENGSVIDLEDVFLPKLKTLHLRSVWFGEGDDTCLLKLISGCHVLEELTMIDLWWDGFWNRSVSSKTLKRLTVGCSDWERSPASVSFDTPNLVYFEYDDLVADKFEIVNFDSLVEASIGLRMRYHQRAYASYGDLVVNATNLFVGISNVQILKLFSSTLEVLTFCCEPIPLFKNLLHLTVETDKDVGWESLPALLKNCPNLETLVFKGLHHKHTIKCEDADGCLCKSSKDIRSCLSSSPVKVLKILKFGEVSSYFDDEEKQLELVKYFLETMPNLEQMILCYNTRIDEGVKSQLERLVPRVSSSKCSVQLICDNFIAPTNPFYG
ncbi:F-box domain, partial [Arabidopsis thaliana x Arabidopsis arenosa]